MHPKIAPLKVSVFPLVRKGGLPSLAKEVEKLLREFFPTFYDESGSIGRRYRRQDEVGTPYGVTVDFQTLEDRTVTIRDRNTMLQERYKIEELVDIIRDKMITYGT